MTVEANKKIVDFLDVTMNLSTQKYQPFTKPNNIILYVHNKSNHPPKVLDNIPAAINKRLSEISSDEDSFQRAVPLYIPRSPNKERLSTKIEKPIARNHGHFNPETSLKTMPILPLSTPEVPYSQFKMASVRRRTNPVDYVNLNNLSSEVLYESGKKPKGKFFSVDRLIFRKKVSHVSLC